MVQPRKALLNCRGYVLSFRVEGCSGLRGSGSFRFRVASRTAVRGSGHTRVVFVWS